MAIVLDRQIYVEYVGFVASQQHCEKTIDYVDSSAKDLKGKQQSLLS